MYEAIQSYVTTVDAEGKASPHTLGAYRTDLRQLQDYLAGLRVTAWAGVTEEHLVGFVQHLGLRGYAATSIARKVAAVKSFFAFLTRTGVVEGDPAVAVRPPQIERYIPRALSPDAVSRLVIRPQASSPVELRDAAMLAVLRATGLRVSELVALDLGDLDARCSLVRCRGRRGRERQLPLPPAVQQALREYLQRGRPWLGKRGDSYAVFLNHHGGALSRQGFWLIMKGHARAAGIADISPQSLRHAFALDLLEQGMEPRAVQERLGHANLASTQAYRHVRQAQADQANREAASEDSVRRVPVCQREERACRGDEALATATTDQRPEL
jgi:integrase/recombinase XerD